MKFAIKDKGLRFPRLRTRRTRTEAIVIHHLDAHWDVHRTQQHHLSIGWNGIGYNLHVAMDGTISLGRGIEFEGAHKLGFNSRSIGIGCEGRYHSIDRVMPDIQFNALVWLLQYLREIYGNIRIIGHRDYAATACPGQFFPLVEVQRLQFRQTVSPQQDQSKGEKVMTQEQFNQMMDIYLAQQRNKNVSDWARDVWKQAHQLGWMDDTAPQGNLTREQAAVVLSRIMGIDANVSDWAKEAWEQAIAKGIVDGKNPGVPATREQVVLIVSRFLQGMQQVK